MVLISPNWKQFKFTSSAEWINKLWFSHAVEYYAAVRMNQTLLH